MADDSRYVNRPRYGNRPHYDLPFMKWYESHCGADVIVGENDYLQSLPAMTIDEYAAVRQLAFDAYREGKRQARTDQVIQEFSRHHLPLFSDRARSEVRIIAREEAIAQIAADKERSAQ